METQVQVRPVLIPVKVAKFELVVTDWTRKEPRILVSDLYTESEFDIAMKDKALYERSLSNVIVKIINL